MGVRRIKFRTQLLLGYILILAIMVAISVVVFLSVNSLIDNARWVEHTHEVIGKANGLIASLVDQETGVRGYLITGREEYLEPYNGGKESFGSIIAELKQTVSDNPAQVKRLEGVEAVAEGLEKQFNQAAIELRRNVNDGAEAEAHLNEVRSRIIGKQIFDGIRVTIVDIDEKLTAAGALRAELLLQETLTDLVNMETGQRGFLLTGLDPSLDPYREGYETFETHIEELLEFVRENPQVGVTTGDIAEISTLMHEWKEKAADPEIDARLAMNNYDFTAADITTFMGEGIGKRYMDDLRIRLGEFIGEEAALLVIRAESEQKVASLTTNVAIFGTLIAVALGVIVVILIMRSVMSQLGAEPAVVVGLTRKVAEGDLSIERETGAKGLLGVVMDMVDSLNEVLSEVNATVQQLSTGSSQVAQASQALSQGATEQASSLEEVSASLNEVNSQSNQNAESAGEANSVAKTAAQNAESGNNQMRQLVAAMGNINESSDEIRKVVKVIDDIAFQINLLALNANVEAARAGKYGKGFAVVADEVRNLAVRSAEAVKETTNMVDDVTKNIEQGTKGAEETAKQLEAILGGSTEVAEFLGEIALASKEQAQGVEQINEGLGQIDRVTQSNTASAEESASAAEELSAQAERLKALVARFKLAGNGLTKQTDREPSRPIPSTGSQSLPSSVAIDDGNGNGKEPEKELVDASVGNGGKKSSQEQGASPKDIIQLDDVDFGKY